MSYKSGLTCSELGHISLITAGKINSKSGMASLTQWHNKKSSADPMENIKDGILWESMTTNIYRHLIITTMWRSLDTFMLLMRKSPLLETPDSVFLHKVLMSSGIPFAFYLVRLPTLPVLSSEWQKWRVDAFDVAGLTDFWTWHDVFIVTLLFKSS